MNKILLIIQREFLNRVQKKSFLIATILLPLVFPALMAILIYVFIQQQENAKQEVVDVLDESGMFEFEDSKKYKYIEISGPLEKAKTVYQEGDHFALLVIPKGLEISKPDGISLFTKINPSPSAIESIEDQIEMQIRDQKLSDYKIDKQVLENLKTNVSINSINLSDDGKEKSSDTKVLFGLGFGAGILIYMFIFIYGMQIMQGVIEEKTSKVVEVIVSSVRPFQLMMGKIVGIASVGLLQFVIWIVLIGVVSTAIFAMFGIDVNAQQQAIMEANQAGSFASSGAASPEMQKMLGVLSDKFLMMASSFLFYFLGGYLLYGSLFAAVGSAVDSPSEAQQFMLPITIPLLIAYFGLFTFILNDPHGSGSFWLSIIPLTSPIAMMGRIPFGVPWPELVLSMALLIGGFIFTTWIAGRIYRVGILMHGTKVNYKVLTKWFMMKG